MSLEFSVSHFVKAFQHILAFRNEIQNYCKWFLKYLKCIHARYEHFIRHSQHQRHTNMNKIKQELLTQIMNK